MLRPPLSSLSKPQLPLCRSRRSPKPQPSSFRPPPRPFLPTNLSKKNLDGNSRGSSSACCSGSTSSACSASSFSPEDDSEDELGRLLALLPEGMRRKVRQHEELHQLIEVVMDLGRKPLARFPSGDFVISELPISQEDLEFATSQVSDFAIDNRAGISRTLHRISALRNRKGTIIGLTCRVGRAISGSAPLLRDLVENGASLLLIGPPGVGKTTLIRELARMLANDFQKRVVIVDTSNEIGGDGDIPHPGIGNARRMQVPDTDKQHEVLIEAVENHMPQVIVIDEIGTRLEAAAASTVARRGIQLVASAHGLTLASVIRNPALERLVGGLENATLGDDEARRRGGRKTVLERKGPPTFSCAVEMVSKKELRVHRSLEATVDSILLERPPKVEVRKLKPVSNSFSYNNHETGRPPKIEVPKMKPVSDSLSYNNHETGQPPKLELRKPKHVSDSFLYEDHETMFSDTPEVVGEITGFDGYQPEPLSKEVSVENPGPIRLYAYGIGEWSIIQVMKQLRLEEDVIRLTQDMSKADVLFASLPKLKKHPEYQSAASFHGIPTFVVKTNTTVQINKSLRELIRHWYASQDSSESEENSQSSETIDTLEHLSSQMSAGNPSSQTYSHSFTAYSVPSLTLRSSAKKESRTTVLGMTSHVTSMNRLRGKIIDHLQSLEGRNRGGASIIK